MTLIFCHRPPHFSMTEFIKRPCRRLILLHLFCRLSFLFDNAKILVPSSSTSVPSSIASRFLFNPRRSFCATPSRCESREKRIHVREDDISQQMDKHHVKVALTSRAFNNNMNMLLSKSTKEVLADFPCWSH